jgi:hypothetical protein
VRRLALALALAGCAGPPHPPGDDATVTAGHAHVYPTRARLAAALHEAFDHDVAASLVDEVRARLEKDGCATVRAPHDDHTHVYEVAWLPVARTLVFLERTGDGVDHLRAWPVDEVEPATGE